MNTIFKEPKCTYFLVTVIDVLKHCPRVQSIHGTLQTNGWKRHRQTENEQKIKRKKKQR